MDYTEDNEFINKQYLMMELDGEYYNDDDIPDIVNGLITKSGNVLKELQQRKENKKWVDGDSQKKDTMKKKRCIGNN